ncbi:MAG: hypothetical protein M0Z77_08250 [Thermoplasmatales archaeon]|jgi:hypothetical protein|nr:hypothetical protein [Candidatus Thermoplasmatota archaeon]MCL6003334.1 hypothetical protein [Candidatus Thermoplasmatota archaeon]MDA8055618.1 hypothetical protein [Thermoplasmatales archaeon]
MTVESEIGDVLRKYEIRHISAFLDENEVRVRVYGKSTFDSREYYRKNRERIRKYQHEYYLRRKGRDVHWEIQQGYVPTHSDLARAMTYLYSRKGMDLSADELRDTAVQVMQFFGFEKEVVGNHLEPEEISLMYQLEDIGLISTRIEEHNLLDGKPWRVNYFVLNSNRIREYSSGKIEDDTSDVSHVYQDIPEEAWVR